MRERKNGKPEPHDSHDPTSMSVSVYLRGGPGDRKPNLAFVSSSSLCPGQPFLSHFSSPFFRCTACRPHLTVCAEQQILLLQLSSPWVDHACAQDQSFGGVCKEGGIRWRRSWSRGETANTTATVPAAQTVHGSASKRIAVQTIHQCT